MQLLRPRNTHNQTSVYDKSMSDHNLDSLLASQSATSAISTGNPARPSGVTSAPLADSSDPPVRRKRLPTKYADKRATGWVSACSSVRGGMVGDMGFTFDDFKIYIAGLRKPDWAKIFKTVIDDHHEMLVRLAKR